MAGIQTDRIVGYLTQVRVMLDRMPVSAIEVVIDALLDAHARGSRVFILGNGGSAATASHFACDLGKGTILPGQPRFRVLALTDNVPLLTAWANDADYQDAFVEQLANLVQSQDVVIGISASGNSPNVLKALEYARQVGAVAIGFTGFAGGKLKQLADVCIIVPSDHMGQIEDGHLILEHLICTTIRERLAAENTPRRHGDTEGRHL